MTSFEPFRLDVANQCLWRGETRISLMPKPFAVLRHLVEHAGHLVTHDQLLGAVWPDTYVQPEVLRRYILEFVGRSAIALKLPDLYRPFPSAVTSSSHRSLSTTIAPMPRLLRKRYRRRHRRWSAGDRRWPTLIAT